MLSTKSTIAKAGKKDHSPQEYTRRNGRQRAKGDNPKHVRVQPSFGGAVGKTSGKTLLWPYLAPLMPLANVLLLPIAQHVLAAFTISNIPVYYMVEPTMVLTEASIENSSPAL